MKISKKDLVVLKEEFNAAQEWVDKYEELITETVSEMITLPYWNLTQKISVRTHLGDNVLIDYFYGNDMTADEAFECIKEEYRDELLED